MQRAFVLLLLFLSPTLAQAQKNYPPKFDGAIEEAYKTTGDVELKCWIFNPVDHAAGAKRPAIVFFFGGGWKAGSPGQFEQHCRYLASRGMVAITADYRVSTRHETLADKCVTDAKSAIRWVRTHADRLGIDPNRVVAGGGSAGGHLAACTGVVPGLDEADEDTSISSVPNAMALFNPAMLLHPFEEFSLSQEKLDELATRTGVPPKRISPIHHIAAGQPPMIVFHGMGDTTVPFETVSLYAKASQRVGNRVELKGYADKAHGFFNYGRDGGMAYYQTVREMDLFLASLGYVDGEPTIQPPKNKRA